MADSSSDSDLPLAQRPIAGILLAGPGRAVPAADSSDESDFPSWLQTGAAGQKGKQLVTLTDSDSDDAVLSPPKPSRPAAAAGLPPEPTPAGNRDVQQPATQQTEEKKPLTAAKPTPRGAAKQKATPRGKAGGEPLTQPAATQPGTQPPATQAGGTAQKRAAAGLAGAPSSQMPLMLPEKLPQMKLLVELESSTDDVHGVTDLSGDSGAIGRLIIAGTKQEPQMQVDLKGVLYNASLVPCPGCVAVVNMGQAEARVETLFAELVQLREDTRFSFVDTDLLGAMAGGHDDDDDVYAGGGDEAGAEGVAAAKKGKGKAAAAGKAKAAPARKRAAPKAKGGVKKGGGKPRAKPKAKPKPAKKK